jgi:hypothetical protein
MSFPKPERRGEYRAVVDRRYVNSQVIPKAPMLEVIREHQPGT